MKKRYGARILLVMLMVMALSMGVFGCGKSNKPQQINAETDVSISAEVDVSKSAEEDQISESDDEELSDDDNSNQAYDDSDDYDITSSDNAEDDYDITSADEDTNSYNITSSDDDANGFAGDIPDENGSYTSKEDVALYLHVYGELPSNFITKKQARKLGWSGGSLEEYAPGKCIGGDYFGNNEGLLPKNKEYHECDIDTLGKKKRGAKRIIYSDDGYIYYTGDHYESFELLYSP